jgi:hypothetical protein
MGYTLSSLQSPREKYLISADDAVLLLKGFKDNLTPVRVNMATAGARCAFEGLVSEISESELVISVPLQLRVSCAMLVQLQGARFDYGDTRKAPPSRRKQLEEKFSSALTILLPDETLVVVSELTS